MQQEEITRELRAFILDQGNFEDSSVIGEKTDLFGEGLLDSLVMANLVWFCEEKFKCTFDTADLTEDSFKSIATISQLISRKLAGTDEAASEHKV